MRRDEHKAIYASSADRGLQVLLDIWPAIRARVPDATLDVFYSLQMWRDVAEASGSQQQRYAVLSLERRMKYMADLGVTYHGGVNQTKLAQAMCGAGALLYPTHFSETSMIVGMEAQAAGLRIVTSPIAALKETVGERGHLIDGDWLDERYQARFVDAAVDALTAPDPWRGWTREQIQAYAREHFSWDGVASSWETLFEELLRESDAGVLSDYAPVTEEKVA